MPLFGQHVKKGYLSVKMTLLGPKSGFRDFSAKIGLSLFYFYYPLTSCNKSEKSLEPFSSNMGITLLQGPFWAIRPLVPIMEKLDFFSGKTAFHVSCPHSSEFPCKI